MAIPFNRNQHYDNRYLSWALFHGDDILCERYYVITRTEALHVQFVEDEDLKIQ
ncbi:hypothetical protein BC2926_41580 [Bacillus cereus]|nr:hypothetical protein BC2926_41580 [Bacillus cereus]